MFIFLLETPDLRIGWSQSSQEETVFAQPWWQIKIPPSSPCMVDPDLQTESACQVTKMFITEEDQDLPAEVASQATEICITGKDQDLLADVASQAGMGLTAWGDQDLQALVASQAGKELVTRGDQDLQQAEAASQVSKKEGDQDLLIKVWVDPF